MYANKTATTHHLMTQVVWIPAATSSEQGEFWIRIRTGFNWCVYSLGWQDRLLASELSDHRQQLRQVWMEDNVPIQVQIGSYKYPVQPI